MSFGALNVPADVDAVMRFVEQFFVENQRTPSAACGAPLKAEEARIAELWIYPIKSCGGVRVDGAWPLTSGGLLFDREFVLVDDDDNYLSQKREPRMALIQPTFDASKRELSLCAPGMPDTLTVPLKADAAAEAAESSDVMVCGASARAQEQMANAHRWFSAFLGRNCRLMRQAKSDGSFQNTSHLLLVSLRSVVELNARLPAGEKVAAG